jgi:signal transduction histidine kinase
VTEHAQLNGRDTARHFRRLYLIALSLIAALAIGGQLLVQLSLTSQRGDGHLVNKAGYQRMLSQRLTLKMMLHEADHPDANAQLAGLAVMRDRWLAAHRELAGSVDGIAYGDAARAALASLFQEVDQPLQRIAGLVATLTQHGKLTPAERTTLMADQELFLPLMDAVVLGFEHSVQARVTFLQRVEFTLLVVTLLVLTLEAVLIFRPAVNRLQASLDQVELRNRQTTRRLESLRHLAGGIAHSFNNLLTSILGHASLERLDALQQQRNTEYIDAQIQGCNRAARIITQLVTYSGHGHFDRVPTQLGPWLNETVQSFVPGASGIRVTVEAPEPAVAAVDRNALKQALEGILTNAVEAMSETDGDVVVRLTETVLPEPRLMSGPYRMELPAGLYACIQVRDRGKGIAPEELDRIFDPYYSSKEFGRGLGLAAVLGIAHGHGGGITVESTPGRGSTVFLFLPLSSREATPSAHPPARPSRRTSS